MKKGIIFGLIIVLAGAAAAAGWHGWQRWQQDDAQTHAWHGNVDVRQVSLAFEGSGRIRQLIAQEGDAVKAGQVLALLDTHTLALQADQAAALVEVQQHTLQRLKNGSRPEEVAQARSRLAAAQADAQRARNERRRLERIHASPGGSGAISAQALDVARSAVRVADASVRERRDALRLLQEGARHEDIEAAEAQLKSAQAQLALLQHQIAQGELRAPVDAVVRTRLLEPGDMASASRPVFALALRNPKWVRIYVREPDLGRVRSGLRAQVQSDSAPGRRIEGTVGYVSSVAEFTPKSVQTEELRTTLVYEVHVRVNDPDDMLRLGQPVTVYLDDNSPRETNGDHAAGQAASEAQGLREGGAPAGGPSGRMGQVENP